MTVSLPLLRRSSGGGPKTTTCSVSGSRPIYLLEALIARYSINIRTASHIADTMKVEKDNLTDLRMELATFVGELMRNHAGLL